MADGEILTLRFERMAHGGEGLARAPDGRVVFVPYVIAGETARVEIVETRRGFARGRLVELLETSADRIDPRCPHFPPQSSSANPPGQNGVPPTRNGCGGCQWQHIPYEKQLEFKTEIVREQFARVGKMANAPILPMIAARNPWFYRNHMQFVVNERGELCLNALNSNLLIPIRVCFIMDEGVKEVFGSLDLAPEGFDGVTLRAGENTNDHMLILEAEDPTVPEIETDEPVSVAFRSGEVTIPLVGSEALTERVAGRTFRISPDSFFQVNTIMAETLVELVETYLEPGSQDTLLDAYGGVGLFGLTLAPRVKRVIEIEEAESACEDAKHNARDLSNVEFHCGRVEKLLATLESGIDLAVVDPPRAGLEREALDALAAKMPRTIAYVSCDTATLARDAARLAERRYHLAQVQPVDMFPQTYHIECVAQFRSSSDSGLSTASRD